MTKKYTGYTLLACTAIFSLSLSTDASAADVNKLVETCVACHGMGGASSESDVPIIGGYSAVYLNRSLTAYNKQQRPCPETEYRSGDKKGTKTDMCQTVKDMSRDDIKQLAEYFAAQKFVRTPQKFDPELAKKGKEIQEKSCFRCHTEGGTVAGDDAGILAGQKMDYLDETFKEFTSGKRPIPEKMKPKLEKLDKEGFDALINYYGSFQ